ncbi:MAG: sodium:phosphate symporter [Hyphomicrobiales bacterium]|nr:MAG: sodium:phosphate symporter [Hyphomicrobiales bacterium]
MLAALTAGFWLSPDFKEIAAGVAIFLFGMIFLEDGFRTFTGGVLEKLLTRTTDKLWKSISFGVVTTSLMQSSSLVSVITISFLSAGLIGLAAGIGIIFGANLGTTTGAWLIAGFGLKVKISAYAMPMLVFGVVLVFQSSKNLKGIGYVLAGLGLLFLGIHYMKEGFEAFRGDIDLTRFAMGGYAGLFLFALIGLAATVVMQSSHATLVLIITALSVGQITYENALALAIGANVGTTITAIIGAMSANIQGKRLAGAHLIFNTVTGVIAIGLMWQIIFMVDWISGHTGIASDNYTLKLAVFHTLFNSIGVLVMSPLVGPLVRLLEWVFPSAEESIIEPRYLNESVIDFPETLIEAVRNEVLHLYDNAFEIIAHGISIHRSDILSDKDLEAEVYKSREIIRTDISEQYAFSIKHLHSAIIAFTGRAQKGLDPNFSNRLFELRTASQRIVRAVKDAEQLQKNVLSYIASNNVVMRNEYNAIRVNIAQILRMISHLQHGGERADVFDLDELKLDAREDRSATIKSLDKMIRRGQITGEMATSLMNDLFFSKSIIRDLTRAGHILFGEPDQVEREAQNIVELDDGEIGDLAANDDD